jgi:hypothetical protein
LKNSSHLASFSNKYPLQRDIFCCSEALLLFGWLKRGPHLEKSCFWLGFCSGLIIVYSAQLSLHSMLRILLYSVLKHCAHTRSSYACSFAIAHYWLSLICIRVPSLFALLMFVHTHTIVSTVVLIIVSVHRTRSSYSYRTNVLCIVDRPCSMSSYCLFVLKHSIHRDV